MTDAITLTATARSGQTGQYVARLTGRQRGPGTFQREWVSRKTGNTATADVDEPGLYEVCDIDKRGDKEQSYYVIVLFDGELRKLASDRAEAAKIARELDAGRKLEEIVAPWLGCEELRLAQEELSEWAKFRNRYADATSTVTCFLPYALGIHARLSRVDRGSAGLLAEIDAEMERLRAVADALVAAGKQPRAGFEVLTAAEAARRATRRAKEATQPDAADAHEEAVAAVLAALSGLGDVAARKVLDDVAARRVLSAVEAALSAASQSR